jgi:hypothetical protein
MKLEDLCDKEHRREMSFRREDGKIIYACTFNGECDWQNPFYMCYMQRYSSVDGWTKSAYPVCGYKLEHNE